MVFKIGTVMIERSTPKPNELCFTKFCYVWSFSYFPKGGWMWEDHLSPTEAKIGADLGNILF